MTALVNWRSCKYILNYGKTSLVAVKTLYSCIFPACVVCIQRKEWTRKVELSNYWPVFVTSLWFTLRIINKQLRLCYKDQSRLQSHKTSVTW